MAPKQSGRNVKPQDPEGYEDSWIGGVAYTPNVINDPTVPLTKGKDHVHYTRPTRVTE